MSHLIAILSGLVALLLVTGAVPAQDITYWGLMQGGADRGVIRVGGEYFAVAEGDEIPGLGTIKKVTDDQLTIRRTLTDEEKQRLQQGGWLAPDFEERHIVNVRRHLVPRPHR